MIDSPYDTEGYSITWIPLLTFQSRNATISTRTQIHIQTIGNPELYNKISPNYYYEYNHLYPNYYYMKNDLRNNNNSDDKNNNDENNNSLLNSTTNNNNQNMFSINYGKICSQFFNNKHTFIEYCMYSLQVWSFLCGFLAFYASFIFWMNLILQFFVVSTDIRMDCIAPNHTLYILKLILGMPGLDVFRIRDEYMYLLTIGLIFILFILCLMYRLTVIIGSVIIITILIIYPYKVHYSIQKDLNNRDIIRTNSNNKSKTIKRLKTFSLSTPKLTPKQVNLSPIQTPKSIIEMMGTSNNNKNNKNDNNNNIGLDDLLKSFVGIESFLKHLVKELSADQYKNAFICGGIFDEIIGWNMILPLDDIPKSNILSEPDFYCRSKIICNNYIRIDSAREINISYATYAFTNIKCICSIRLITKPELNTIFIRFDLVSDEIRKLLSDSFRRFCLTPECKKFVRDYNAPVRRLHRRLSKSVRSFAREMSRDRSMSKDMSDMTHTMTTNDESPRLHSISMKRLHSYPSRSNQNNNNKLENISEYKEYEHTRSIVPPMSLLSNINRTHSNMLALPDNTNSLIINQNNQNHNSNIMKFSAYSEQPLTESINFYIILIWILIIFYAICMAFISDYFCIIMTLLYYILIMFERGKHNNLYLLWRDTINISFFRILPAKKLTMNSLAMTENKSINHPPLQIQMQPSHGSNTNTNTTNTNGKRFSIISDESDNSDCDGNGVELTEQISVSNNNYFPPIDYKQYWDKVNFNSQRRCKCFTLCNCCENGNGCNNIC